MISGIVILCGISLALAIACHYIIRSYFLACLLASTLAIAVFLIVSTMQLGHLDPFFMIAIVVGWCWAFAISSVAGIPFAVRRWKKRPLGRGFCKTCGYNLTGNQSGICSECGTKFRDASVPGGDKHE